MDKEHQQVAKERWRIKDQHTVVRIDNVGYIEDVGGMGTSYNIYRYLGARSDTKFVQSTYTLKKAKRILYKLDEKSN